MRCGALNPAAVLKRLVRRYPVPYEALSNDSSTATGTLMGKKYLGDCRKITYQIAPDFRPCSRSGNRRIVELCNCFRDAEDGRKDK